MSDNQPCFSETVKKPNSPYMSVQEAEALHKKEGFSKPLTRILEENHFVLEYGKENYPESLMRLNNPPKKIYGIGNFNLLTNGLSIVGARKATPYGLHCAARFGELAALRGITIISGGATGCDIAAHKAALNAGCPTVVVLGGGCHRVYPAKHFSIFQKIINEGGVVISEQEWDFPPLRHTFRMRNRIIAGLSKATLIVEAGLPSGTFSTADEALEAQREVLVVPGAITSPMSSGANQLIYQGATPIISEDVFLNVIDDLYGILYLKEEKGFSVKQELNSDALKVFESVVAVPLSVDEIQSLFPEKSLSDLVRILTNLELCGYIARFPDGKYASIKILK